MANTPTSPPDGDFHESGIRINPAINFSVQRYVLSIGAFVAVVIFGFISGLGLGVDQLPNFDIPTVAISTTYAGASPESVEQQLSKVIEDSVSTIAGVSDISSTSGTGSSLVTVSFASGTDINNAANEVSQKISSARAMLPTDSNAPVVQKIDPNARSIISVAISGSGADLRKINDFADKVVKNRLQRIDGVADVSVSGAPQRKIEVLLDPAKLAQYSLSPSRVTNAIQGSSLDLPAGSVENGGSQVSFATRNIPTTLSQVERIVVDSGKGLMVSDVGVVRDSKAEPNTYSRLNGEPVVLLAIRKASGSNTTSVAKLVTAEVKKLSLPKGYHAIISGDTSRAITNSVSDTAKEAFIVAIAVAIVSLIALGRVNTAFAVVLAIPISLAAAPLLFAAMGYTFNIITLLAMIVAMGIVVDDSIVVAENVERYRKMGYGLKDSVLKGASEVLSAATAATFSLLGTLIPLAFIPGIIGGFFGPFALGLAAAIFFSWLEALFFLTVRMAYTPDPENISWSSVAKIATDAKGALNWLVNFIKSRAGIIMWVLFAVFQFAHKSNGTHAPVAMSVALTVLFPLIAAILRYLGALLMGFINAASGSLHAGTEVMLDHFKGFYGKTLFSALGRPGLVLIGALLFLLTGIFALTKTPFEFSPKSDESQAQVTLTLPPGTSLEQTNIATIKVEEYLQKRQEVKQISTTVGSSGGFFSSNDTNKTQVDLDLVGLGEREGAFTLMPKIQDDLQKLFADHPEISVKANVQSNGPGGSYDLELYMVAPDQKQLEAAGQKIISVVAKDPDVLNVSSSLAETVLEKAYIPNQSALSGTGLSPQELAQTMRTANAGSKAGDFQDGEETYDIVVRVDPNKIQNDQSFLSLPVFTSSLASNLTLGDLGKFELRQAPSTLYRFKKQASASLNINLKPGVNAFAKQPQLEKTLKENGLLNEQVSLTASGFSGSALTGNLALYGPLAILISMFLNYLVLGAQFNSFRYPVYLLLPVPLAIVGGLWALVFFKASLDVITILGMVVLIGLSTKNSILLLDFVVHEAKRLPLKEALVSAAQLRLRPIIMTTLTVLTISFPLIYGGGEGAEFRRGLGIIILGGVVTSAVLTLFVVPAAFYRFERKRFAKTHQTVSETSSDNLLPAS